MAEPRPPYHAGPECPDCHARDVVPIIYGYPSAHAVEAAQRGELLIGGWNSDSHNPRWSCRSCGRRFSVGDVSQTS